jgi:hypothetical protein
VKLRKSYLFVVVIVVLGSLMNCRNTREVTLEELRSPKPLALDTILDLYLTKYHAFLEDHQDTTLFPRCYEDGQLIMVTSEDWTSGFFPGILWYLYEYSGDRDFLHAARAWTHSLKKQEFNTSTHDIGFIINNSYGHGFRITKDKSYKEVLSTAANSLASRFNENIGCIKSLDFYKGYDFPVLIDNMVNLEILFKVWQWNNDVQLYEIANEHALKTMEVQFKPDFSAYQIVDFDSSTFKVVKRGSFQGYADSTSWARGQAWGLYGFTLAFRETKDRVYLDQAIRIASYIMDHPNFPSDCIPYWDFETPDIPETDRDASAAAIIASALVELSGYPEVTEPEQYLLIAENILSSFITEGYIAGRDECENFILKHCIGNFPGGNEIDVSLIHGDYYYLEALIKYKNRVNNELR